MPRRVLWVAIKSDDTLLNPPWGQPGLAHNSNDVLQCIQPAWVSADQIGGDGDQRDSRGLAEGRGHGS